MSLLMLLVVVIPICVVLFLGWLWAGKADERDWLKRHQFERKLIEQGKAPPDSQG